MITYAPPAHTGDNSGPRDLPATLPRLDEALHAVQSATDNPGSQTHRLLTAVAARAHGLITTAPRDHRWAPPG